jgi:hypothetical protein
MLVRQGIEHGAEAVVNFIRSRAIPVESQKEIAQIVSVSAADEQYWPMRMWIWSRQVSSILPR